MTSRDFPVIILAAGASSRMGGRDKLLEDVDGAPLLRQQVLKAQTIGPVMVALPPAPHPRYAALDGLGVEIVTVPDAAEGMNASLRRAFAALPRGTARAMLLLGDLPDLTADDLGIVADAVKDFPEALVWRGVTQDGRPGHPIIFDAALFDIFQTLKGDGGGRAVIASAGERIAPVPLPNDRAVRDLDTPEEWAVWRDERAGNKGPG